MEQVEYGTARTELLRRGAIRLKDEGLTNKQIAKRLDVTEHFVRYLLNNKNKEI